MFARDFSGVRVHDDGAADRSTAALGALAYTVGTDVVFAPGRYVPSTVEGRALIRHELTHVAQQGGRTTPSGEAPITVLDHEGLEAEAETRAGASTPHADGLAGRLLQRKLAVDAPTAQPIGAPSGTTNESERIAREGGSLTHAANATRQVARFKSAPGFVRRVLGSHARPLAPDVRHVLEQRFGRSLGEIRIHSDQQSADSARAIGARGYSYGNDIVLDTAIGGERLGQVLMHELVHTAQAADRPRTPAVEVPMSVSRDDAFEREARAALSTGISRRGPAILRRDEKDAPTADPRTGAPALDMSEELLIWRWLSRWEVDPQERTLLRNRLGADHAANVHRIAREIWLRRLASRGRVDPRILLSGEAAETDEMRNLQEGPVKALYERAVYIQEQQLSQRERDEVETQVAAFGLRGRGRASPLTGDPRADTTVLTRSILCSRLGFIVHAPLDPLFCIDDAATEANPLFQAFRATVISPLYADLRRRPGEALVTAMREGRLGAGRTIAGQIHQIAETGAVQVRHSTVVPTLGLLKMLEDFAATSTPRARGDPDFEVASIARETAGPHGTPTTGGFQVGRAVDITRFAGHRIHIDSPVDAVAGIAAAMRALPPGCYIFGLPRPPRDDPIGGLEDLRTYPYFFVASPMPGTRPPLSRRGADAIRDNPFLPAVNLRRCPTRTLAGDLAQLLPGGKTELTAAAHDARVRGRANILCLFPDGADHLHIQVEACPARRSP